MKKPNRFDTPHDDSSVALESKPDVCDVVQSINATRMQFLSGAVKINNPKVELYAVNNFLNEDECAYVINLIRANNRDSTTTGEGVSDFRTSKTCDLQSLKDPIIQEIDRRICHFMGIPVEESEPIEGQFYEVGQQFKAHTDYLHESSKYYAENSAKYGNRSWTFMVYLNSTNKGGATEFPDLKFSITPTSGTAIIWNNRNPDNSNNPHTIHGGKPVIQGFKAVITKWFRTYDHPQTYVHTTNEFLQPMNRTGFMVKPTHPELQEHLLDFYNLSRTGQTGKIALPQPLKNMMHSCLLNDVENWVGDYIQPTFVDDIYEYEKGSTVEMHRDRMVSQPLSAMCNVDKNTKSPWTFVIEDKLRRRHEIELQPGQIIFYEGARLLHGFPKPLQDGSCAIVFAHFRLKPND